MNDPFVGELHMIESVILPNRTRRVKFRQLGQVPDGRYVVSAAWMDKEGTGHAVLAWKENLVPQTKGENHDRPRDSYQDPD